LRVSPAEGAPAPVVEADATDAVGIAALYAEALPPGWPADELAECFGNANRAILKATQGGCLCGFAILQIAAGEAEILAIAVAKEWRRRGCAASLMRAALNLCMSRFVSCIYLEVAESNRSARELYEKFGFLLISQRKNYYRTASSAPETALIMKLDINLSGAAIDQERSST
jgi:ribosomal-protein-alanine N-acetyltransferase